MPLFDYRCNRCNTVTEAFIRAMGEGGQVVCSHCGSVDTVRLVSRFVVRAQRTPKYSEEFREKALPFLKTRPGVGELLAESGQSEEAATFELTERIGARVDGVLEDMHG